MTNGAVAKPHDTAALEGRIASKIDLVAAGQMQGQAISSGAAFLPQNVGEVMEFAKMMAVSTIGVRKHLRNNPGACLSVAMQAFRWGMDPFAVANKSYLVNDQIAYESQLITAVLNQRAPIIGRIRFGYEADGNERRCTASARLAEVDDEPVSVTSPKLGDINPKNSPLWKSDPDQQLAYYTSRSLARRYFPEVLLGVYDIDELHDLGRYQVGDDGTARPAAARPTRADFGADSVVLDVDAQADEEPFFIIDADGARRDAPLTATEFTAEYAALIEAVADRAAFDALAQHNADDADRLSDSQRAALQAAITAMNQRLRRQATREASQEPKASASPAGPGTDELAPAEALAESSEKPQALDPQRLLFEARQAAKKGTSTLEEWFESMRNALSPVWMHENKDALLEMARINDQIDENKATEAKATEAEQRDFL